MLTLKLNTVKDFNLRALFHKINDYAKYVTGFAESAETILENRKAVEMLSGWYHVKCNR